MSSTTTPIALYANSSQFRNWRYSKAAIERMRSSLNVQAVGRVKELVEEERAQAPETAIASSSKLVATSNELSRSNSPTPVPSAADIQYLTVADELSLVTFYLTKISQLCGAFRFPEMVEATAMSYLKRFYLRNTCMDYHPKNVMLTSLFLATKTENHLLSIDTFAGKIKTTPEEILSLEFLVSQSLHFEYKVHHAHFAGHGLSLDMETANISQPILDAAWTRARALIRISRLTDAEFIYTPSQIALAAFRLADATSVDNWLGLKEPRSGAVEGEKMEHDALRECLVEIGELILEAERKGVDTEAVREVDIRLRWARNPEKDPKSAIYKKRQADEELQREAKANAKAAKRPTYGNDGDVFG